jgi:uncharacterized protein (UPF0332 family)
MAHVTLEEILERSKEFLQCADYAVQNDYFNACAICCYASLFWAARAALAREGYKRETWTHSELRSKFTEELVKIRGRYPKKFGTWLANAFKLRNLAQYQFQSPQTRKVRRMVAHAKEFINLTEKMITK